MVLPTLNLIVPASRIVPPDDGEADLVALYGHAPGVLRANMIATVDGGAWGPDHVSGSINDDADWRVFRVQRALADVVVVGAGTARAERYTQLGRPDGLAHLRAAPLELALVTRSGDVPPLLVQADRLPYVITGARGAAAARAALPADRVIVVPAAGRDGAGGDDGDVDRGDVDLAAGLSALAARGLRRVLCEGGPHLLADLLAAGLVDELCVTTSPRLVGPGPSRIVAGEGPASGASAAPAGARLAHLLHEPAAGTLLARWLLLAAGDRSVTAGEAGR